MEDIIKDELEFYSKFAKPLIFNLSDSKDRVLAAAWVKKIREESSGTERLRTDYLKLLLFALQRQKLVGIFADDPGKYEKLDEFPPDSDLNEIARNIIEKEQTDRQTRIRKQLQGQVGDFPPYTTDHSSDLREYVAAQDIPGFGVHCYYAISKDPLNVWQNVDKGVYPKMAKSAVDTTSPIPPGVSTRGSDPSCVCPPTEGGTDSECKERVAQPPEKKKKKRLKKLGKIPPTSPLGTVLPPEDRMPPTWGTNLTDVKDLPIREGEELYDGLEGQLPFDEAVALEESVRDVQQFVGEFKRGAIGRTSKKVKPKLPKGIPTSTRIERPTDEETEDAIDELIDTGMTETEDQDEEEDLETSQRIDGIQEDSQLIEYFKEKLIQTGAKEHLAKLSEEARKVSPSRAGVPVTTPKLSPSPKRPRSSERLYRDDYDLDKNIFSKVISPLKDKSPLKDLDISQVYEEASAIAVATEETGDDIDIDDEELEAMGLTREEAKKLLSTDVFKTAIEDQFDISDDGMNLQYEDLEDIPPDDEFDDYGYGISKEKQYGPTSPCGAASPCYLSKPASAAISTIGATGGGTRIPPDFSMSGQDAAKADERGKRTETSKIVKSGISRPMPSKLKPPGKALDSKEIEMKTPQTKAVGSKLPQSKIARQSTKGGPQQIPVGKGSEQMDDKSVKRPDGEQQEEREMPEEEPAEEPEVIIPCRLPPITAISPEALPILKEFGQGMKEASQAVVEVSKEPPKTVEELFPGLHDFTANDQTFFDCQQMPDEFDDTGLTADSSDTDRFLTMAQQADTSMDHMIGAPFDSSMYDTPPSFSAGSPEASLFCPAQYMPSPELLTNEQLPDIFTRDEMDKIETPSPRKIAPSVRMPSPKITSPQRIGAPPQGRPCPQGYLSPQRIGPPPKISPQNPLAQSPQRVPSPQTTSTTTPPQRQPSPQRTPPKSVPNSCRPLSPQMLPSPQRTPPRKTPPQRLPSPSKVVPGEVLTVQELSPKFCQILKGIQPENIFNVQDMPEFSPILDQSADMSEYGDRSLPEMQDMDLLEHTEAIFEDLPDDNYEISPDQLICPGYAEKSLFDVQDGDLLEYTDAEYLESFEGDLSPVSPLSPAEQAAQDVGYSICANVPALSPEYLAYQSPSKKIVKKDRQQLAKQNEEYIEFVFGEDKDTHETVKSALSMIADVEHEDIFPQIKLPETPPGPFDEGGQDSSLLSESFPSYNTPPSPILENDGYDSPIFSESFPSYDTPPSPILQQGFGATPISIAASAVPGQTYVAKPASRPVESRLQPPKISRPPPPPRSLIAQPARVGTTAPCSGVQLAKSGQVPAQRPAGSGLKPPGFKSGIVPPCFKSQPAPRDIDSAQLPPKPPGASGIKPPRINVGNLQPKALFQSKKPPRPPTEADLKLSEFIPKVPYRGPPGPAYFPPSQIDTVPQWPAVPADFTQRLADHEIHDVFYDERRPLMSARTLMTGKTCGKNVALRRYGTPKVPPSKPNIEFTRDFPRTHYPIQEDQAESPLQQRTYGVPGIQIPPRPISQGPATWTPIPYKAPSVSPTKLRPPAMEKPPKSGLKSPCATSRPGPAYTNIDKDLDEWETHLQELEAEIADDAVQFGDLSPINLDLFGLGTFDSEGDAAALPICPPVCSNTCGEISAAISPKAGKFTSKGFKPANARKVQYPKQVPPGSPEPTPIPWWEVETPPRVLPPFVPPPRSPSPQQEPGYAGFLQSPRPGTSQAPSPPQQAYSPPPFDSPGPGIFEESPPRPPAVTEGFNIDDVLDTYIARPDRVKELSQSPENETLAESVRRRQRKVAEFMRKLKDELNAMPPYKFPPHVKIIKKGTKPDPPPKEIIPPKEPTPQKSPSPPSCSPCSLDKILYTPTDKPDLGTPGGQSKAVRLDAVKRRLNFSLQDSEYSNIHDQYIADVSKKAENLPPLPTNQQSTPPRYSVNLEEWKTPEEIEKMAPCPNQAAGSQRSTSRFICSAEKMGSPLSTPPRKQKLMVSEFTPPSFASSSPDSSPSIPLPTHPGIQEKSIFEYTPPSFASTPPMYSSPDMFPTSFENENISAISTPSPLKRVSPTRPLQQSPVAECGMQSLSKQSPRLPSPAPGDRYLSDISGKSILISDSSGYDSPLSPAFSGPTPGLTINKENQYNLNYDLPSPGKFIQQESPPIFSDYSGGSQDNSRLAQFLPECTPCAVPQRGEILQDTSIIEFESYGSSQGSPPLRTPPREAQQWNQLDRTAQGENQNIADTSFREINMYDSSQDRSSFMSPQTAMQWNQLERTAHGENVNIEDTSFGQFDSYGSSQKCPSFGTPSEAQQWNQLGRRTCGESQNIANTSLSDYNSYDSSQGYKSPPSQAQHWSQLERTAHGENINIANTSFNEYDSYGSPQGYKSPPSQAQQWSQLEKTAYGENVNIADTSFKEFDSYGSPQRCPSQKSPSREAQKWSQLEKTAYGENITIADTSFGEFDSCGSPQRCPSEKSPPREAQQWSQLEKTAYGENINIADTSFGEFDPSDSSQGYPSLRTPPAEAQQWNQLLQRTAQDENLNLSEERAPSPPISPQYSPQQISPQRQQQPSLPQTSRRKYTGRICPGAKQADTLSSSDKIFLQTMTQRRIVTSTPIPRSVKK